MIKEIIKRIEKKDFKVAVIGLGYVGLPLAVEFAKNGLNVIGIDVSRQKVQSLLKNRSYIKDVSDKDIELIASKGKFSASLDFNKLKDADAAIVCVPTPLSKTREPDMSYIVSAAEKITECLHKGQIIVLESTTYPGTTEEAVLPILEKSGLKAGKDFFLGFSPERVDPSNKFYKTSNIPKVIGGVTPNCTKLIKALYSKAIKTVVPVSSARVAEMVKLLENTFRAVNIGLINEICLMSNQLKVDVWEVIRAAGSKPFGFMSFKPGPGLGGHCLPIDPLYLSWKARLHGFESRFIGLADQINSAMPAYVVKRVAEALNKQSKTLKDSKILVIGVAYKAEVDDMRESPAFEIIKLLKEEEALVNYHDPFIPEVKIDGKKMTSQRLTSQSIKSKDCVLIITDHKSIDYTLLKQNAQLIFDTRNVYEDKKTERIVTL